MINVRDFGAVGDGEAFDSPAIQKAIDHAVAQGGGTVLVPAGIYRCGTIQLFSNIHLFVEPGAVIRSSHDIDDFPALCFEGDSPGMGAAVRSHGDNDHRHLLFAKNCERVKVSGGGLFDGQGPAFWNPQTGPRDWITHRKPRVSPCLEFEHVTDLTIDGIRIEESPGWTLHTQCCDRVRITGVDIDNHRLGPNNDGFDINGCRDVMISDCRIDTCDDAIVIKCTKQARSSERITITNCILSSNCAAIKCGTESWFDFKQIAVSNCVVTRSTRAFALYGFDGGNCEQITVSNLICDTDLPFVMNMPIHLDARKRNADSKLSTFRDIRVRGFTAKTDGRIVMTAAEGTKIENVTLDGVHMDFVLFCDPHQIALGTTSAQCSKASPEARGARAAVVAENVENLRVRDLTIDWPVSQSCPGWGEGLVRIENGGTRKFKEADQGDDVAYSAIWARGCANAKLEIDDLKASKDGAPDHDIADCPNAKIF